MLVRLTGTQRLRAGWLVALVYLLCVLSPTISFALPGSGAISPCLTETGHVPGMGHVHNEMPTQHDHGQAHDHAAAHATSDDDHRPHSVALHGTPVPEKALHASDGQCCGLICISALPAPLVDLAKPSSPTALCAVEGERKVTDNAPSRRYRPPIV